MKYYSVNTTSDELYHHGVLGMKWGVRKDRRAAIKTAKINRKSRDTAIQNRYNKAEQNIESSYKKGQLMSAKDRKRLSVANNKARNEWVNSKKQYKSDVRAANGTYGNKSYGKVALKGAGRFVGARVAAAGITVGLAYAAGFGKIGEKQLVTALKVLGPALTTSVYVGTLKDAGQTYMNRKWSKEHLKKDFSANK